MEIMRDIITRKIVKIGYCENPQKKPLKTHFENRCKNILHDLRHYDVTLGDYMLLSSSLARKIEQSILKKTKKNQIKLYGSSSPVSEEVFKYLDFITTGFLTEYRKIKYDDIRSILSKYEIYKEEAHEFVYIMDLKITGYSCLLK